ncbi:bacterial transcriptional activator domain-containing protein [Streptomyces sp. NPDC002466]|uniref:bacterial transcriptional activator domain-containing protein n=1 Tax=unclassified Streptomyces TaxID=2593676 RepID=UPI00292A46BC|nr:bacterial transcriptional activator domain-containing protein [Streptomyces sp. sk2.1]
MDPLTPWSVATLNARLQGMRRALGNDSAGNPYRLAPAVRCDWARFLQLAERALPQAAAGLPDLEKALSLVRGRPFGTRPLPWAEPYQQEMITRIVDVAHTVAAYRTAAGPHHDLGAARQAIVTGLEVDEHAELLYRDWMRIEAAAGNRSGLHTAISRVQQVNRALDCDLELETEQLISELLNSPARSSPPPRSRRSAPGALNKTRLRRRLRDGYEEAPQLALDPARSPKGGLLDWQRRPG